jgi:rubrerythrin
MDREKERCMTEAVEMEKEGKAFYLKAAAGVADPFAKTVFEELAADEDRHIQKINEIYERMRQGDALKEWITCVTVPGSRRDVFGEGSSSRAKASGGDLDALRIGLEMEEKSTGYYQGLADKAQDRYEKRFYLALAQEERGHYLKIMDSIEYLSDPEGWHRVHERLMVDGG